MIIFIYLLPLKVILQKKDSAFKMIGLEATIKQKSND